MYPTWLSTCPTSASTLLFLSVVPHCQGISPLQGKALTGGMKWGKVLAALAGSPRWTLSPRHTPCPARAFHVVCSYILHVDTACFSLRHTTTRTLHTTANVCTIDIASPLPHIHNSFWSEGCFKHTNQLQLIPLYQSTENMPLKKQAFKVLAW